MVKISLSGDFEQYASRGDICFGDACGGPKPNQIRSGDSTLSDFSALFRGTIKNDGSVPVTAKFLIEISTGGKPLRHIETASFTVAAGASQDIPDKQISVGVVKDGEPLPGYHFGNNFTVSNGRWVWDMRVISDQPVSDVPRFWFRSIDGPTVYVRPWAVTVYPDDPSGKISATARVIGVDGALLAEQSADLGVIIE